MLMMVLSIRVVVESSPGASVSETLKYRAFLSYSRADAGVARRVRGRLERFRIDRELFGRSTRVGPVPEALRPIFRSRHDFYTKPSLGAGTAAALADSAALILLASPHSARGKYVNKQVKLFRACHPERPVVVLIIEGAPDDQGNAGAWPALRFAVAPDWAESPADAMLPDLCEQGDGLEAAVAKVVARLIGLAPQDVHQRAERARRRRGRIRTTIAAAMAVLATASGFSFLQAQRQQAARAEIAALVRTYSLASPTQAAIPGAKESLTQAIIAIAEGAATDPRYANALDLLRANKAAESRSVIEGRGGGQGKASREGRQARQERRRRGRGLSDPGVGRRRIRSGGGAGVLRDCRCARSFGYRGHVSQRLVSTGGRPTRCGRGVVSQCDRVGKGPQQRMGPVGAARRGRYRARAAISTTHSRSTVGPATLRRLWSRPIPAAPVGGMTLRSATRALATC
jgi:acyl-coenzyme A thioesterase PaaI-like protein